MIVIELYKTKSNKIWKAEKENNIWRLKLDNIYSYRTEENFREWKTLKGVVRYLEKNVIELDRELGFLGNILYL